MDSLKQIYSTYLMTFSKINILFKIFNTHLLLGKGCDQANSNVTTAFIYLCMLQLILETIIAYKQFLCM